MDRSGDAFVPIVADPRALRGRRLLYGTVTTAVFAILGLAVLDGFDIVDSVGVDTRTATATSADGHVLTVEYTAVTRPALASPLRIEVTGLGEGERIRLGIERAYFTIWDHNAAFPAPDAEAFVEPWVVWEYEAGGPTLIVEIDARLEPGVQSSRAGRIALLDPDGRTLAGVDITTHVRP
jgi:hypothetical protein